MRRRAPRVTGGNTKGREKSAITGLTIQIRIVRVDPRGGREKTVDRDVDRQIGARSDDGVEQKSHLSPRTRAEFDELRVGAYELREFVRVSRE